MKKKWIALVLTLVMVLSLLLINTMAAEQDIKYNSYPFATAASTSSVTLAIEAPGATNYQWQEATEENGTYTNIDGATAASYYFTPTDGAWYRCVVDGAVSKPVQTIKANSSTFLRPNDGYWYIGNGTMAYTLLSGTFDIVGKYTSDGNTYWMNTSYNRAWSYGSSTTASSASYYYDTNNQSGIEYVRLYFSADPRTVDIDVKLNSNQKGFAVGTDTMLGNSEVTDFADNASLKAILKDGKLSQVQMVGALSLDDAQETDPAFVFRPVTPTDCFWVGAYGQNGKGVGYSHNTTSRYSYSFTEFEGKQIVTEICNEDSALAVSWLNIPDNGIVQFQFSVGTVAETGAQIAISATSKTVTIADASSDYYYALYKKDGTAVKPWTNTIPAGGLVFDGLESDTEYVVKAIAANDYNSNATEQNESKVTKKDITTAIDPFKPNASAPEVAPVAVPTKNSITLNNLNPDYSYALQDANGNVISNGYKQPTDGTLTFSDLEVETTYYLVAKTDSNNASDKIEVKTLEEHSHEMTKTDAKAATCTANGNVEYYTCTGCGKAFADAEGKTELKAEELIVKFTGHEMTKTDAKAATCTDDGNVAYYTCSGCEKHFADAEGKTELAADQLVVKFTGHEMTKTDAKAATCTADGNVAYYTCSVCDKTFADAEGKTELTAEKLAVKSEGHKIEKIAGKAPTYIADGNKEYYHCNVCDTAFADAEGKTELTASEIKDLVIPQLILVAENKAEVSEGAVDKALSESTKGEDVTLDLTHKDVVGEENVGTVTKVELPVVALETMVEEEKTLTLVKEDATVTLDAKALETIVEQAEGNTVTLVVKNVEATTLKPAQQAAVESKKVAATISAELICDQTGEKIATKDGKGFGGGAVTVAIPVPEKLPAGIKASDLKVYYVADNGTVEHLSSKLEGDKIVFTLMHFSEYVIAADAPAAPIAPPTGDNSAVAMCIMLAVISVAAIVLLSAYEKKGKAHCF